jgi:hypothetical protein
MSLLQAVRDLVAFKTRPEVLLQPNVPKPLHGVAPRVIFGKEWWDRTRREAYASTGQRCLVCGVHKNSALFHRWLEGHEVYRIDYRKGLAVYVETVPLCHACHCFIHDGRLKALLEKGEVSLDKYRTVMAHGRSVLRAAGLNKRPLPNLRPGLIAPWGKWRMVVGGKKHKPIYKDFNAWAKHHGYLDE